MSSIQELRQEVAEARGAANAAAHDVERLAEEMRVTRERLAKLTQRVLGGEDLADEFGAAPLAEAASLGRGVRFEGISSRRQAG